MKTIFIIFIFFFMRTLCAQDELIAISPGAKFGYAFGEKGGFVFGLEVSAVWIGHSDDFINNYGAVLSFENIKGEPRFHFGLQSNFLMPAGYWSLLGLEVVPTFIFRDSSHVFGVSLTQYYGVVIIPYYRLLIIPGEYLQHEVGSFVKFHISANDDFFHGH